MKQPRKIEVAYSEDRRWLAQVEPMWFDASRLMYLIEAVQESYAGEALVFVIDKPTVDGIDDAEAQFLEASEKSGAFVVWSTECS
jgi:hypothetical protein